MKYTYLFAVIALLLALFLGVVVIVFLPGRSQVSPNSTVKKVSSNRAPPANLIPLTDGMIHIQYGHVDSENMFSLKAEAVPKFIDGVFPGPPHPNEPLRLRLASPRVYEQQYEPDSNYPLGQRYLVGVDAAGITTWAFGLTVARSGAENDYLHVSGVSPDGIILVNTSSRGKIIILDPRTGKTVLTKKANTIFRTYHAFNPQTMSLYLTEGYHDPDAKQVSLLEWNTTSNTETKLATLTNQMITNVKPHIERMMLDQSRSYLLMIMELASRGGGKLEFVIFDLKSRSFIYKEALYRFGTVEITLGQKNRVGVFYSDKSGRDHLNVYTLNN